MNWSDWFRGDMDVHEHMESLLKLELSETGSNKRNQSLIDVTHTMIA